MKEKIEALKAKIDSAIQETETGGLFTSSNSNSRRSSNRL